MLNTVPNTPTLSGPLANRRRICVGLMLVLIAGLLAQSLLAGFTRGVSLAPTHEPSTGQRLHDNLPLAFIPNEGQAGSDVRFQTRGLAGTLFFTQDGVTLHVAAAGGQPSPATVTLRFQATNPAATVSGDERLPGVVNYFAGDNPDRWQANLPTYRGITYHQLYNGVDLYYEGLDGALKGTYFVATGGDPAQIVWRYAGTAGVRVDGAGDLVIDPFAPDAADLVERAPIAWQEQNGQRVPVPVRYAVADGSVRFEFPAGYDPTRPLTIDPTLTYGTYLGASSTDTAYAVAVNNAGNVYLTGKTYSPNFPGSPGPRKGTTDVFVTKFNPQGTAVLFTTILGGNDDETGSGIAVDAAGNVWITGETESTNFPTQSPLWLADFSNGYLDTFATKLNTTGGILFSTYLGVSSNDRGSAIALDPQGNAYITGEDYAPYGPEVFVRKVAANGSQQVYQVFFGWAERGFDKGSSGKAIAVDAQGYAYVTGRTNSIVFPTDENSYQQSCSEHDDYDCTGSDAFVTKVNLAGDGLIYSTYLGGSSNASETGTGFDEGRGIAVDAQGYVYVSGSTFSLNFPVVNAEQESPGGLDNFADAFVTKFTPDGGDLVYSTYLGGEAWEEAYALALDGKGNAYVTGITSSTNFPVSADALQPNIGPGICINGSTERYCYDAFVTAFGPTGAGLWSTYLGGSNDDLPNGIAYAGGSVYVAGGTESYDLPTTAGVFQRNKAFYSDAFVIKLGAASLGSYRISLPMVTR